MIWAILLLSLGLLLAVLPVVLLRKRLGLAWLSSLAAGGLLVAACGGWFTWGQIRQSQERREIVYMSLQYLKQGRVDEAAFYLKKTDSAETFASAGARSLLELLRDNEITARLNLDSAEALARSAQERELLPILKGVDVWEPAQLQTAVGQLESALGLSQKRREALDFHVRLEAGGQSWDQEQARSAGLGVNELERLTVSSQLGFGSYEAAVSTAVGLADRSPTGDNRLLLAEAVAECAYRDISLPDVLFDSSGSPSAAKERARLDRRREKAERDLAALELSMNGITDAAELDRLNARRLELTQEILGLRQQSEKIYVYRALNSIADLRSLEAQLTRARLYFALQEYEQAVDTLLGAARSFQGRTTPDRSLANALRIVEQAYSGEGEFYDSQEFSDSMTQLLSAPFSDLLHVSQSSLTKDFVQRILSDQKTYGRSLSVSGLDASQYPKIKVTLSGREPVLREIVDQAHIVSRDTRKDISYTAQLQSGNRSDVCVLLDRSGSMGGEPMLNLKEALRDFVQGIGEETSLSLVAFDSRAERLTELTQDQALLLSTVDSLSAGGGTDITAGIQAGLEVLEGSAGSRCLLLMTDGQSSVDTSIMDEAARRGIIIHTIGFGSVNDSLLQEIADRTGGQYVRADSSSELRNVYASLQQLIGHFVTLEYTVTDTETANQRYFFLDTGAFSVRREYALAEEGAEPFRVQFCNPALTDGETFARLAAQGNPLRLTLYGEGLDRVERVTLNGREGQLLQREADSLQVDVVPDGRQGWQTLTLITGDGEEYAFDRLLLSGEIQSWRDLRIGNLLIPSARGILPGDGTLVVGGSVGLQNSGDGSLALWMNGTLILPEPSGGDGDLGEQASLPGWGLVRITQEDGAYDPLGPQKVAGGGFTLDCRRGQGFLIR